MRVTKKFWVSLLMPLMCVAASCVYAATETVKSPDGQLIVNVSDDGGVPYYQATYRGQEIIKKSVLGLEFKNADGFVYDLKIAKAKKSSADSTWEQPWGEQKVIRDKHNELLVRLTGIKNDKKISLCV